MNKKNEILATVNNKKYSKCSNCLYNNWKIFESSLGSLTDDLIRKQLFPLIKEIYTDLLPNQCIYDIGGNVGDITKMLNNFYPHNKIFTVEPVYVNFKELRRKYDSIENIKLFNIALGAFNGKKISHTFGNGNVGDYLYPGRLLNTFEVNYMTLDNFYKEYSIYIYICFVSKIDGYFLFKVRYRRF